MSAPHVRFELGPSATAPRTARRLVSEQLSRWEIDPHHEPDVLVVVTELVSNAVDHADDGTVLRLDLSFEDARLRIGLADGSSVRPVVRQLDPTAPRGRGMQIVAEIAHEWGAEDHDGGKRVWVDLGPVTADRTADTAPEPATTARSPSGEPASDAGSP